MTDRLHMKNIEIKTTPTDFCFPTTNQTRHSFTLYIEFRMVKNEECEKFARFYHSRCPSEWVDKWNEQREIGTFLGPI
ncbi:hypothetical protein UlMin_036283 [Ulmus minor]